MTIYAVGLHDLDVCYVGGDPFVSLVGSYFEVADLAELAPDYDAALEEELAWLCLSPHQRRMFVELCLRAELRPLCRTARDLVERLDGLAKATLAHRILSTALDFDQKTRAGVVAQLERLRGELAKADEVWARASGLADVLVGDRA